MFNQYKITCLCLILLTPLSVSADEKLDEACKNIEISDVKYFKVYEQQVYNTITLYCSSDHFDFPNFINSFKESANHLSVIGISKEDYSKVNTKIKFYIDKKVLPKLAIPEQDWEGDMEVNREGMVVTSDITSCDTSASNITAGGTCKKAFVEFAQIFNKVQAFQAHYKALVTKGQFQNIKRQWDDFLEVSKSQTIWELAINGALYKKSESASFRRPPDGQWIFMHPGLVIENVSASIDGEQLKEALILDVIGYNWWKQDIWYLPTGISVSLLYSDRPGISDSGESITLHFGNKYQLGFTRHDKNFEDGIFISFDLLEFVKNKKQNFKSYTSNFK
ncbi:MAG: hypothetical protein KAI17_08410 [Thiotrichaceae bacterium]|nr:hypothetical protein [Thiotrichaceae bacterium]